MAHIDVWLIWIPHVDDVVLSVADNICSLLLLKQMIHHILCAI